jgi:hypothetical protein
MHDNWPAQIAEGKVNGLSRENRAWLGGKFREQRLLPPGNWCIHDLVTVLPLEQTGVIASLHIEGGCTSDPIT